MNFPLGIFIVAMTFSPVSQAGSKVVSCVLSQTRTSAAGVADSINYLKVPEVSLPPQKCSENDCDHVTFEITPELFPETKISISATTAGEIAITFFDRGGIAPAQGKAAFISATASGSGTVLLSTNVTRGDSYPVKGNSITVACTVQ